MVCRKYTLLEFVLTQQYLCLLLEILGQKKGLIFHAMREKTKIFCLHTAVVPFLGCKKRYRTNRYQSKQQTPTWQRDSRRSEKTEAMKLVWVLLVCLVGLCRATVCMYYYYTTQHNTILPYNLFWFSCCIVKIHTRTQIHTQRTYATCIQDTNTIRTAARKVMTYSCPPIPSDSPPDPPYPPLPLISPPYPPPEPQFILHSILFCSLHM